MTAEDIDGVVAIAAICFPHHPEDRAVFVDRLTVWPAGCFALQGNAGDLVGYAVAYPYAPDAAPPLNTMIDPAPGRTVLYIHDVALLPEARGGGFASEITVCLRTLARSHGLAGPALVAVNDAVGFWARRGFEVRHAAGLEVKLAGYGADARYMVSVL